MAIMFGSLFWDAVAIFVTAAVFVYHYLTWKHNFWDKLNIPYVKPHFLFGNMKNVVLFKKTQFETFLEFYNHFKRSGHKFGGIFQLREPVFLVCCAELAKDIFVKSFVHFHDRAIAHDEHFDPLSAHLVALEGQKWKFIRSKLSPAFSTSKLKGMLPIIEEMGQAYVKTLGESAEKGESVEMRKSIQLYLMDIIGAIAFGIQVNAQKEESQFLHMGKKFFEPTEWERVTQVVLNTYRWLYKTFRIKTIPKETTEFFMGVLRDAMDYRRKNKIQKNDFLQFLMRIKDEKGSQLKELEEMKGVSGYNLTVDEHSIELTEGVIAAQAFVFFLAGYETSSSAMSTCVHLLAHHPEIQEKILVEVNAVSEKFGHFTYEAVHELVYVEQVLEETLRMYPPVGLTVRRCTKAYPVPGTQVIIPKGCQAFIPVYSFHHDPEYFPDPEVFRPERFSPENRHRLTPYAFMPFGHGPRVCIGQRLSMMEMKLTLALLIKNFQILKCEKTTPFKINPKSFFMSPIDGLWVRLSKRKNTN